MKKTDKALIYALSAVLLWSTVATAFKIALQYVDYLNLLFYSSLTSATALLIIIIATGKLRLVRNLERKELTHAVLQGILNPFLYYLVLFRAYSLLRAQEALTLNYTWAVMVVLLSAAIFRKALRFRELCAIMISFSGVLVIATKGSFDFNFDEPLGIGLALGSSLIWALFWVMNIGTKTDETVKLFISFVTGFVLITITVAATGSLTLPSSEGLAAVVYVGLFEMGITFVLWLKALNLTDSIARTSNLVYLSPFLSLAFINVIIGESVALSSIAGLALIMAGIILQQSKRQSLEDCPEAAGER